MINRLPSLNKRWIVSYKGKFLGDINYGANLDLFSDKGRIKIGGKIYPHTTQSYIGGLGNIYAMTKANIFDGDAGERENKLWAISENKVIKNQEKEELFEVDNSEGLGVVGTNSDILSVGDETEEDITTISLSITGTDTRNIIINGIDNCEKAAQIFQSAGPLKDITISLKKVGTTIDDLQLKIQEDDNGVPSGTDLATKTISSADITTTFADFEIEDFHPQDYQLEIDKTYWLIFERTGAADADNFYVLEMIKGESGEFRSFNGTDWIRFIDEETDEESPTDNNAVPGETGWSNPTNAYTDDGNDAIYASVNPSSAGERRSHVWKGFGFSIPAHAIISGIEIQTRLSLSTEAHGRPGIYVTLTKDADSSTEPMTNRDTRAYVAVATYTLGDEIDLWSTGWTPAEVNDADFGVRLDSWTESGVEIDVEGRCQWIKAKVYYYEEDTGEEGLLDTKLKVQTSFPAAYERLYATTSKDVMFLNGDNGYWQSLWRGILEKSELNDEYPAIIKHLGSGGLILLANDNKVHTFIATANTPSESDENKLIFDSTHYINWVRVTTTAIFIGLCNKTSEHLPSQIVYYEPFVERTRIYTIKEGATMGFIINENCHILDKSGQVRIFNGVSFETYQYFPPFYRGEKITKLPHRNGVIVKNNIASFLWEGQYPDPAGVWVLEENNLYHKHSIVFDKDVFNSLGAIEVNELGAIYQEDDMFLGAILEDGNQDKISGIYSSIKSEDVSVEEDQRLSLITGKFISPEINNLWQDVVIKYDPDGKSGDISLKYRSEPARITEGSNASAFNGEWISHNEFTCSDDDFVVGVDDDGIRVGDEIIVRKGQGAGLIAHITAITGTTTKTVTIDSGLSMISSGKFTFSIEAWKKITTNFRSDRFSHKASLKDKRLEQTQLKVVVDKFILEEIQLQSESDKTIKK
jgi:hypothetical protein